MLFDTMHFVSLPVGQVKPKNNLPEVVLVCLGQALISNPALSSSIDAQGWCAIEQDAHIVQFKQVLSKVRPIQQVFAAHYWSRGVL